MPVRKGGADFTAAPAAILHFRAERCLAPEDSLVDLSDQSRRTSVPVVILAETAASYFVASDPLNQRGRWGKLGDARPRRVLEIPRDSLTHIDQLDQWPRPEPANVSVVFVADSPATAENMTSPGVLSCTILKGTRASVLQAETSRWLVWTEDGRVRAWVSGGFFQIQPSK